MDAKLDFIHNAWIPHLMAWSHLTEQEARDAVARMVCEVRRAPKGSRYLIITGNWSDNQVAFAML